jgi:aminoglycoside phosphotransferase (APT) family kinase protein
MSQANTISHSAGREVGQLPHYQELLSFFGDANSQPADLKTLVHGDFKIDNLVFHKTEARVIGILDWEMATEGHPLSDYVNLVSPFLWAADQVPVLAEQSITGDVKTWQRKFHPGVVPGLPTLEQCEKWYHDAVSWNITKDMEWAIAFSNFRTAIIMQGITARLVAGQASGIKAKQFSLQTIPYALWSYARVQKIIKETKLATKL